MKLAEALAERATLQARLTELTQRAVSVARIQEGDAPDEDPAALTAEVERLLVRLEELISRINATNSTTAYNESLTITDAIAQRDIAARRQRYYAAVADAAAARQDRFSRSEVKFVATVDVAATRAEADASAQRYRELDTRLQQLNWSVDLI